LNAEIHCKEHVYVINYYNFLFILFTKGLGSCLFQSVAAKKKYPVDKALEHFDDFYKTVFGRKWPSIRLALLSPRKYCAVINNFGDSDTAVLDLQVMQLTIFKSTRFQSIYKYIISM
jgi:hypothetical protein